LAIKPEFERIISSSLFFELKERLVRAVCERGEYRAIVLHELLSAIEAADMNDSKETDARATACRSSKGSAPAGAHGSATRGAASAPVASVRQTIEREADGEWERIAKILAAGISAEGHEWLACLASYLAGCSAEEAEKLAQAIRAAKKTRKD
jgi:hypothetical protein